MKKWLVVLTFLMTFAFVLPAFAVVSVPDPDFLTQVGFLGSDWSPAPSNTAIFEARLGQPQICYGDWKFGLQYNGAYLDTSGQRVWESGVDVYFRISHDKVAGTITMDLSGCCAGGTKTWQGFPGEGIQDFFLIAKTSDSAWTSEIHDLYLNGVPVNSSIIGQNDMAYMRLFGKPMDNSLLEGYIRFSWYSGNPWHSQIEAMFSHSRSMMLIETNQYFADLQYLLDSLTLQDGDHINGQFFQLYYPLIEYDRPNTTVTLEDTVINGSIIITNGKIIADNLIIR
jgi:hypothetical protein